MTFTPLPHLPLTIRGQTWQLAEHPAAPGIAYGQEGRAGTVFQLLDDQGQKRALKVFRARFRLPSLVTLAEKLKPFASLPGLQACERIVLTPSQDRDLLSQYPELTYAVLMPWIEGPTWQEVILERKPLPKEQALALARALAETLTALEERGLAHGDLSGPNVMLPALDSAYQPSTHPIALVDVEQMYAPGMDKPNALTSGSMGYAHREAEGGLWGAQADRFAGAVLLAEMLAFCDPQVTAAAWGESYFDPAEMQQDAPRYQTLLESLRHNWGEGVAGLFQRAWTSDSLADCPTFGEWMVALPQASLTEVFGGASAQTEPAVAAASVTVPEPGVLPWPSASGKKDAFERQFQDAVEAYRYREWARARELLQPIVQEAPNYAWGGYVARELLAQVEKQLRRRPFPAWAWGVIGALVAVIGLGAMGAGWLFLQSNGGVTQAESAPIAQSFPTQTPAVIVQPAQSLPTYTPYPTYTPQSLPPTQTPPPTDTEQPAYSSPSGKIVFSCQISQNSEQNEICMMNVNGTGFRQLTNNGANNGYASFAPDGRSIVFVSNISGRFQVYELDLTSGSVTQLTYDEGDAAAPDISPDGRQIVYKCSDANTLDYICVMNRDGSNIRRIYTGGWDPVWSPDGTQILFAAGDYSNPTFYTISANGSGLRALPSLPNARGRSDWSSLGVIASYAGAPGQRNIYILNDFGWKQITNGGNSQAPSFSPDGQWIAFTGYFDHMNDQNGCEIYIMTIDGNNLTRLTNNDYCDWQPRWGP